MPVESDLLRYGDEGQGVLTKLLAQGAMGIESPPATPYEARVKGLLADALRLESRAVDPETRRPKLVTDKFTGQQWYRWYSSDRVPAEGPEHLPADVFHRLESPDSRFPWLFATEESAMAAMRKVAHAETEALRGAAKLFRDAARK